MFEKVQNVVLFMLWYLAIPCVFALFYTVIEAQNEARLAVGENSRLAPFVVSRLANRLDDYEARISKSETSVADLSEKYSEVKNEYINTETETRQAMQMANALLANPVSCDLIDQCMESLLAASVRFSKTLPEGFKPLLADARDRYKAFRDIESRLKRLENALSNAHNNLSAYKLRLSELSFNPSTAQSSSPALTVSAGKETPSEEEAAISDNLRAVALSYSGQRQVPGFEFLYFLPSGVIVATFTGVMGGIGAAIYSLYLQLTPTQPNEKAYIAYAIRPVLGALAGFTVFFVISAGTTFLIQPDMGDRTQAVHQLSPPALASIGLFAGLGADKAMAWLIEKATSFFKIAPQEQKQQTGQTQ